MARVPYVAAPAEGSPDPAELRELYAEIAGLRGGVHNLYRVLAHNPAGLRAFMGMSRYVRDEASLDPRLRELAVLATAYALDVPYELHHHVPAARRAGVSDVQLRAFPGWETSEAFDPLERAAMAFARELALKREVDDATFAAVERHLGPAALVDLTLTVGWYHLVTVVLRTFDVERESDGP